MASQERVTYSELKRFSLQVLEKVNACNEQGKIFINALLWSDLVGRSTHGIWRLPAYIKRIEKGLMKCPCSPFLLTENQATGVMDGDQGIGHYVGHSAMSCAIEKARSYGIGAVGVRNSNHFGTGAYYAGLAARQNMVGIAVSNSLAKVAPYGGVKAVLGTNPFAFAIPGSKGQGMMFDMATTVMAGSQVMKYAEAGKALPDGIAIDHEGNSIRDPNDVNNGVLLPFGGAKGFGISLMVEILSSVLTGANFSTQVNSMFTDTTHPGQNGHFFLAIDIGRFIPVELFVQRAESLFSTIKNSAVENDGVLIPGEIRWRHYKENSEKGLLLDQATLSALNTLAENYLLPGIGQTAQQQPLTYCSEKNTAPSPG